MRLSGNGKKIKKSFVFFKLYFKERYSNNIQTKLEIQLIYLKF